MPDLISLGRSVGELLKERNETVAVAESSTGGLISAALLSLPGASAYFVGGGVIYTRHARAGLLMMPESEVTVRGSTEPYALNAARLIQETAEHHLGPLGERRHRPHRQPLRRRRRPQLHGHRRTGGEGHHHRDRRFGP